ncbi:MAG: radical SAM protein [Deferribacteres bacterium]|nr:radical SAM protein [Deferribacteres bacterium]
MNPCIREVRAKAVLSKSGIPGRKYCINPYVGCAHACRYCYATFMKRFTGHAEPWGSFTDVRVNAPEVLRRQLRRAEKGNIIISSVTDPYQPVEGKYMVTRKCLEVLALYDFPVDILTKSPLISRDIDIILKIKDAEAGITITTDDERIRKIFEPAAPPVPARIEALKRLHEAGIRTYVFIGPVLPMNPRALAEQIRPYAGSVIIDRMNYTDRTRWLYRQYGIEKWLDEEFTGRVVSELAGRLGGKRQCQIV